MLKIFAKQCLLLILLVGIAACSSFAPKEEEVVPVDPRLAPISSEIEAQYQAALEQMKAEAYEEAEAGFTAITQTHDYYAGPWKNLGMIYTHKKQYDEAISMFEKARLIDASNPENINQLAWLYRKKGDFTKARSLYEEGLVLAPENAQLHINLGILLDLYMGDIRAALPHYEQYQALTEEEDKAVKGWIVDLGKRIAKLPPLIEAEPVPEAGETQADAAEPLTDNAEDKSAIDDKAAVEVAVEEVTPEVKEQE